MKQFCFAVAFLFGSVPAYAGTPTESVRFFYDNIGAEFDVENRERFAGKAQKVLDSTAVETEEPCIDFALALDAQDYDEAEIAKSLKLAESIDGLTAIVDATFLIFGEPREVLWALEKTGEDWKVTDIFSPDEDWRLTKMECKPAQ